MNLAQSLSILALWLLWTIYWAVAARGAKPVLRRETWLARHLQSLPLIGGGLLILLPDLGLLPFDARYLAAGSMSGYGLGALLVGAGLIFTIWARHHLGTNWSVSVTLKLQHELIESGPYGWVRHPIYTGGLLAVVGSALAGGEWRGLLGAALVTGSLLFKLRKEEHWLSQQFGTDYADYRRRVAALLPGLY